MERKKVDDSFEQGVIKINSYQMDGKVLLEVIDNGIGIEKEVKDNIFKFGFTTKEEGSGFGLHSCYNFIKSNEGKLTVDSSGPKQGAVVQVSFPLLAA
jgi:signal transduction histidine kinase